MACKADKVKSALHDVAATEPPPEMIKLEKEEYGGQLWVQPCANL
jgi:hypothetical protein